MKLLQKILSFVPLKLGQDGRILYNELGGIGQLDLEGLSVCMKTMALYSHAQSPHFTASLCDSETSETLPGMSLASQLLSAVLCRHYWELPAMWLKAHFHPLLVSCSSQ